MLSCLQFGYVYLHTWLILDILVVIRSTFLPFRFPQLLHARRSKSFTAGAGVGWLLLAITGTVVDLYVWDMVATSDTLYFWSWYLQDFEKAD